MEILEIVFLFCLSIGDSLYREGDFFGAITSYKYELFEGNVDSLTLMRKIALASLKNKNYLESATIYSDLYFQTGDAHFQKLYALSLLRAGNYDFVKELISPDCEDGELKVLRGLALGFSENYDSAYSFLDGQGPIKHWKHYKLNSLVTLSKIIPGSGLIFLNEVPLFIGTLGLSAFGGYLVYYYFHKKLYYEAIFSGLSIFQRFYGGGISNTRAVYNRKFSKALKTILDQVEERIVYEEETSLFNGQQEPPNR